MPRGVPKKARNLESFADRALTTKRLKEHTDNDGLTHIADALYSGLTANLGNNLKLWRERADLTQSDVAKATGISERTLQRMESNEREPDLRELLLLSSTYGTCIDALLGTISETTAQVVKLCEGASHEQQGAILGCAQRVREDDDYYIRKQVEGYTEIGAILLKQRYGIG